MSRAASFLEHGEGALQTLDVCRLGVDEEVDVLRGPQAAVEDDGETADQDVAGPGFVEGATDPADVVDRRSTDLRDVSLVSHSWASSKVSKRNRPRGARPAPPRSAHRVS
jgi:hypothetical protein